MNRLNMNAEWLNEFYPTAVRSDNRKTTGTKPEPVKMPVKKSDGTMNGTIGTLPDGINKKMSHEAQTLSKNEENVDELNEK